MKIICLNGSPKLKNSCSSFLLKAVESRLQDTTVLWHNSINIDMTSLFNDLNESQILLLAFPLYVDGLPSHLIKLMQAIECKNNTENQITIYTIANCGFYEGKQNKLALEMLQVWTKKCGFKWGYGIGIGAGGMIQTAPIGKGPNMRIGKIFDTLATDIKKYKSRDNIYISPNVPRFLYLHLGHISWKKEAKQNKVPVKSLKTALKK